MDKTLIKFDNNVIERVGNFITVTDKLLATTEPQLIPYRKKNKWGFCTPDKKIVIDCVYDDAYFFNSGSALIRLDDQFQLIDNSANVIVSHIQTMTLKEQWYMSKYNLNENNSWSYLIVELHKRIGDFVDKTDWLFEIETDKACYEVDSQVEGILLWLSGSKGDKRYLNDVVAVVGKPVRQIPVPVFSKINNEIFILKNEYPFPTGYLPKGFNVNKFNNTLYYTDDNGTEFWED